MTPGTSWLTSAKAAVPAATYSLCVLSIPDVDAMHLQVTMLPDQCQEAAPHTKQLVKGMMSDVSCDQEHCTLRHAASSRHQIMLYLLALGVHVLSTATAVFERKQVWFDSLDVLMSLAGFVAVPSFRQGQGQLWQACKAYKTDTCSA